MRDGDDARTFFDPEDDVVVDVWVIGGEEMGGESLGGECECESEGEGVRVRVRV